MGGGAGLGLNPVLHAEFFSVSKGSFWPFVVGLYCVLVNLHASSGPHECSCLVWKGASRWRVSNYAKRIKKALLDLLEQRLFFGRSGLAAEASFPGIQHDLAIGEGGVGHRECFGQPRYGEGVRDQVVQRSFLDAEGF